MTSTAWADGIPLHPILTGVSVNLRLDIYSDGRGSLACPDDTNLNLSGLDKEALAAALGKLWDRAVHEASRRNYFKS